MKRGNLESWCAWAFFGYDFNTLSNEERKENNEIVNYIERLAQWKFPEGFQENLPSVRLDLDPIFATQRPLVFYATIFFINMLNHIGLYILGFRKRYDASLPSQAIYYRKAIVKPTTNKNNHNISNPSSAAYPLVFVHGIGIGYAHYLAFISSLPPEIDVYLIEWPHVAMQVL